MCPCDNKECDKIKWKYFILSGDIVIRATGTKYHVKHWSGDAIYGPYPCMK